ncbi:MAG: hypothetical protein O2968_07700 [Acidobacteria bacterium]|nr:hypothetical protein [Acidobacteriota bacterium]
MKIGAEKNKIILLAVVSMIALYTVYTQLFSGPPTPPAPRPAPQLAQAQRATRTQPKKAAPSGRTLSRGGNFRPVFGTGADDEPLDPMIVDPTLRTDLWTRVKSVEFSGVERDLFRFGERKKPVVAPPDPDKVAEAQRRLVAAQAAPKNPKPAAAAPKSGSKAPPISFKYYGFASAAGSPNKRAFLLDGEDVLIGAEGDVFKKRYKIIRIGLNSIVVEDMQFADQQELKLQEGPA